MNHLLLTSLALWYVARLLIYERGLWSVFYRWRALWGIQYDATGQPHGDGSELSYLFSCITCLGFWLAVVWVAATGQPAEHVLIYAGLAYLIQ